MVLSCLLVLEQNIVNIDLEEFFRLYAELIDVRCLMVLD